MDLKSHKFNSFQVLYYPFQYQIWFLIIISFVLVLFLAKWASLHGFATIKMFSLIACTFGIPINDQPIYRHSLLVYIMWIWYTFIIRTLYSGLMYNFFTNDVYEALPRTINEAVNRSYTSVMNNFTFQDLQDITIFNPNFRTDLKFTILNTSNEFMALDYLENHSEGKAFAILSQEFFISYVNTYGKQNVFYLIPEPLLQQQLCLYLRKHSFLIQKFDRTILNLKAFGLLEHWKNYYFADNSKSRRVIHEQNMIDQTDLWGIFSISAILYLVSVFIFLLEVLSVKIRMFKKLFD